MPYQTPSLRGGKFICSGLVMVAVGGYECKEARDTFRTGILATTARYHQMDWPESLGVGVVTIALGVLVVLAGLGWVKPRAS